MTGKKWLNGAPPINLIEYELTLYDGSIRTAKVSLRLDCSNLFYTDCTSPYQNAYCNRANIFMHRKLK